MKCLYYLAPTLNETHRISENLHAAGVDDWFVHIVSKDEAGLKKKQLHSSNYLETLDLVRNGFIGANIGFIVGVFGAALMMFLEPFGPNVPAYVYLILIAVATLFGAWEGGLFGVHNENQKLKRFHEDIDAGKYLLLIYTRRDQEDVVKKMMAEKHSRALHVGTDQHFINPFAVVRRKRGTRQNTTAAS